MNCIPAYTTHVYVNDFLWGIAKKKEYFKESLELKYDNVYFNTLTEDKPDMGGAKVQFPRGCISANWQPELIKPMQIKADTSH